MKEISNSKLGKEQQSKQRRDNNKKQKNNWLENRKIAKLVNQKAGSLKIKLTNL